MIEFSAQSDGSYRSGFGGDVSNVAIAAARQGTKTAMITHVGADRFGDDLVDLWQEEAVDTYYVQSKEGRDTGLYFVHHVTSGHHFTYRRRGSACSQIRMADIPAQAITDARMFYTSTIALAVSETLREATIEAILIAKRNDVTVTFDPNLREKLWPLDLARVATHDAMKHCDIALPGLDDARRLTGHHAPDDIIDYYRSLGASVVAMTLGSDGVAVSAGEGIVTIPGYRSGRD